MPKKNIYRRSDGRWEARLVLERKDNGNPKIKSFYGKTKEEAAQKREEFIKNSKISLEKNSKFSEICRVWMSEKKQTLKQSSISTYESKLEKYILPYFGNMPFSEADCSEEEFMKHLKEDKSISDNFCKELITLYRSIIYWYKEENHNVCTQKDKVENLFFTDEEIQAITREINRQSLELAILLYTGMTVGELSALKWNDCDLQKKVIKVSRTLQRVPTNSVGETLKTRLIETGISEREIPIAEKLAKLMQVIPKSKRKGYVIAEDNNPIEPRVIQYRLKVSLEKIGINGGNPTKFRDTFAIKAIRKDINPLYIARVLGIKEESFIKRYQSFLEETLTFEKLRTVVEIM